MATCKICFYIFLLSHGSDGVPVCLSHFPVTVLFSAGEEILLDLTSAEAKDSGSGCCGSDPSFAVDGTVSESNLPWSQCLQWTSVADPWWGVDLGAQRRVTRVKLYNRNDCCPDRLEQINIYLGDNFDNYSANAEVVSGISVPQHSPLEVVIDGTGRYLFVARPGQTGLTLCEIQVWISNGELHKTCKLHYSVIFLLPTSIHVSLFRSHWLLSVYGYNARSQRTMR